MATLLFGISSAQFALTAIALLDRHESGGASQKGENDDDSSPDVHDRCRHGFRAVLSTIRETLIPALNPRLRVPVKCRMRTRRLLASIALVAATASAHADVNRKVAPVRWEGLSATEWRDLVDGLCHNFGYRCGKVFVAPQHRSEKSYNRLFEMGPRAYPYLIALTAYSETLTSCVALSTLERRREGYYWVATAEMAESRQRREAARKRQEELRIHDGAVRHAATMVAAIQRIGVQKAYDQWKAKEREAGAKGELATAFERTMVSEAEKRHAYLKEHYESTFGDRASPAR